MRKLIAGAAALALCAFAAHAQKDFVKGADVGFLPGQEKAGVKFHDRTGKERECLDLLKNDYELSAIRMRVWVDPENGVNDKNELLAIGKRAKDMGMDFMVDFHYADSWADPGKQPIPKAWEGHDFEQMKRDLKAHTVDVLTLLKENGVTPRWVQVGNETANGLLWPMGHIEKNPEQYAGFIGAGYDAVKEVFPEAIVIVHLDRGHNQALYDWNLDIVRKYGDPSWNGVTSREILELSPFSGLNKLIKTLLILSPSMRRGAGPQAHPSIRYWLFGIRTCPRSAPRRNTPGYTLQHRLR